MKSLEGLGGFEGRGRVLEQWQEIGGKRCPHSEIRGTQLDSWPRGVSGESVPETRGAF